MQSEGSGYTAAPRVLVSGGGGSGALAEAIVEEGRVTAVQLLKDPVYGYARGEGYTSAPVIRIEGGEGSGATAVAEVFSTSDALVTAMSQDDFRTFLQQERSRELCFEGLRRYDLMRWHLLVPRLRQVAGDISTMAPSSYQYAALSFKNVQEKHYLFPIPSGDRLLNEKLIQNPGY